MGFLLVHFTGISDTSVYSRYWFNYLTALEGLQSRKWRSFGSERACKKHGFYINGKQDLKCWLGNKVNFFSCINVKRLDANVLNEDLWNKNTHKTPWLTICHTQTSTSDMGTWNTTRQHKTEENKQLNVTAQPETIR